METKHRIRTAVMVAAFAWGSAATAWAQEAEATPSEETTEHAFTVPASPGMIVPMSDETGIRLGLTPTPESDWRDPHSWEIDGWSIGLQLEW